ncbi:MULTISPECIES: hypothetical protein [Trichocoleus]|uniref:Uncharacterized protein n=1 Tax=Trichocoleus desertorum GB2-A4 TaxID=2933944 RepID=A0ABV0JID8_9CYAN|nr:hypothetical protein [Trichocoleus sp. FACHB-46]MBD1865302.1 hypothetical protein [Trichocoleus sp. FACHB-46]
MPQGFQLAEAIANSCTARAPQTSLCREGPNYTLVYRNAQNTCFLMRAVAGGVGGGVSEFELQTRTTLLGEGVSCLASLLEAINSPPLSNCESCNPISLASQLHYNRRQVPLALSTIG